MRTPSASLLVLPLIVTVSGGFGPAVPPTAAHPPSLVFVQVVKSDDKLGSVTPAAMPAPVSATPETTVELPAAESSKSDPQAEANRLEQDRLIADANGLRARYRDYRTGRSRQAIPLYEFRTMEHRLARSADADPKNIALGENLNAMRMIQGEILGPAVARSMVVKRKLFASQASGNAAQPGMTVSVAGRDNTTARFVSPGLTRQAVMKLGEDARIFEQLRMLNFRNAVFSDGRRNRYTYDVAQQRLR